MKKRGQWFDGIVLFAFSALLVSAVLITFASNRAYAGEFSLRQLRMSSSIVNEQNVEYELTLAGQSAGNVGSIRLQICSNDPFPGQPCAPMPGLDFTAAFLQSQGGTSGYSIAPETTAHELVLRRASAPAEPGTIVFRVGGVTNPSAVGSAYGRLETFTSTDASGGSKDAGGLAYAVLQNPLAVHTYVPPYLLFCIGQKIQDYDCTTAQGNYIDFGELSPARTATGETKLLVATNAEFGYTIRAQGTTLTSGVNVIPGLASTDVSRRGVSQFGMNLRQNSVPNGGSEPTGKGLGQPTVGYNTSNMYRFVPGEVLASYAHPDNYRLFTANYIVNVNKDQPPGVYVTTLTYIALATF